MDVSVVVWWTIDSLRRDVCSPYGGVAQTNALSRLADRGTAFEGRSEATWTLPSVASMLTGLPQDEHGVRTDTDRLEPGIPTLPQYFRQSGWRTIGIVANPWYSRRKGLDIGFDFFYNITEDGSLLREVSLGSLVNYLVRIRSRNGGLTLEHDHHPTESLLADFASEQLRRTPKPVFIMVHTQGAHSPYHHPSGWDRHTDGGSDRRSSYLNLVEYVDAQLGRFLDKLDDSALVIATSDHGEALGESDMWGHKHPEIDLLYDVPLVINTDDPPLSDPVTHIDVHRWLKEDIAPSINGEQRSERLQERLEALGYVDGKHTV